MNKKQLLVILASLLVAIPSYAETGKVTANGEELEITDDMFYHDKYILILKSTEDYNEAVAFAVQSREKLGLKFDNDKVKYSKSKGIYFSEDIDDVAYRGKYYPRRYDGEYISLENSNGYYGFSPGYIIVVGGIYSDKKSADKGLSRVKEFYKDAYAKKTVMWMGCIH